MDRTDCSTNAHIPAQVPPDAASPDNQSKVSSVSQPTAANQANTPSTTNEPSTPQLPVWMAAHVPIPCQQPIATSLIHHLEELDLTHGLMLDSGMFASITCNKAHVAGIRLAEVPLQVGTNGGLITVAYQAVFNVLLKLPAWFYPKGNCR